MSEFKTLKSITSKIGSGATPRGGSQVYQDNGTSFIRSQNVQDMHFSKNGLVFLNDEQAEQLKGVTVKASDVLLNITGDSIARSCLVPDEMLPARVNQHVSIIRCKNSKDAEYVAYYLQFLKPYLLQICKVGGTRNALTKDAIENLKVNFLEDRHARGSLLASIDKKIELNNRINAELEAMAKTLYDYWFVQFDFPDDSPQRKGKPYKSSGGKMVYNPILKREIPEGWGVKKLSEIAMTGSGGTPLSSNPEFYENGTIPWINSGELNSQFIVSTSNFITELGLEKSSAKLCPKNTILMAMYGATAGKVSFIDFPATTNQAICTINPFDQEMNVYLKFTLERLYQYLINLSSGSARDNLSQDKIKSLDVVIPAPSALTQFHEFTKSKMELILTSLKENQELTSLRDWLLPMLMNGQVTVK
ncbi:restriction endonuclease subunit S [Shewanella putrefaciens]|uniref:restriction endonuclease subunit S n=1 Tax=Shewanella putrefaciens TaxID=24 RepID=UPI0021BE2661|nr:restriction endonuclease subunit S [Shewanella putrefaciens]UXK08300.1 restriction endonuclease subunit S [Shewanella putrefaciens]